jgi:hypothetical protein
VEAEEAGDPVPRSDGEGNGEADGEGEAAGERVARGEVEAVAQGVALPLPLPLSVPLAQREGEGVAVQLREGGVLRALPVAPQLSGVAKTAANRRAEKKKGATIDGERRAVNGLGC